MPTEVRQIRYCVGRFRRTDSVGAGSSPPTGSQSCVCERRARPPCAATAARAAQVYPAFSSRPVPSADLRESPFDAGPFWGGAPDPAHPPAPSEAIASMEYGVSNLGCPLIMVMGHSSCGAIDAARRHEPLTPLLECLYCFQIRHATVCCLI